MKIDEKDFKIMKILRDNAKLTTSRISKLTRIPITTVHNRIKKLKKEGIIKNYTINLDYKKVGKGIKAYILVNYTPGKLKQEETAKKVKHIPGIEAVDILAGGTDLLAIARVKDIEELNDLIIRKLREVEGVEKTQTMIRLGSA